MDGTESGGNAKSWSDVVPMTPTEAELEMQFIVLDLMEDDGIDTQQFFAKLGQLFNRTYLAGWQDCHAAMEEEVVNLIMEGIAYYGGRLEAGPGATA